MQCDIPGCDDKPTTHIELRTDATNNPAPSFNLCERHTKAAAGWVDGIPQEDIDAIEVLMRQHDVLHSVH